MRIGIIGGTGWLGSALGRGLIEKGVVRSDELSILNRSGPARHYHGHQVNWASGADALVEASDVIVLSIRPADWLELKLEAKGRLVISFLAGLRMETLATCGGDIIRVMPNAAAELGLSYSPWVAASGVNAEQKAVVEQILSAIGTSDELEDEGQLDLMTAVSGSGPAYPALWQPESFANLIFLWMQPVYPALLKVDDAAFARTSHPRYFASRFPEDASAFSEKMLSQHETRATC